MGRTKTRKNMMLLGMLTLAAVSLSAWSAFLHNAEAVETRIGTSVTVDAVVVSAREVGDATEITVVPDTPAMPTFSCRYDGQMEIDGKEQVASVTYVRGVVTDRIYVTQVDVACTEAPYDGESDDAYDATADESESTSPYDDEA